MSRLAAFAFIVVVTVGVTSSTGCDDPTCVTAVLLENDSATDRSYAVTIDDETMGTLSPGERGTYCHFPRA